MSVKSAPSPRRMRIAWIGAGVLCAGVLVLLWVTAHQIKERKLKARYGEAIETPTLPPVDLTLSPGDDPAAVFSSVPPERSVRLTIVPGQPPARQHEALELARQTGRSLRFAIAQAGSTALEFPKDVPIDVEHFMLRYGSEGLSIFDARGRYVVEFTDLKESDVRRWQELQIKVDRVDAAGLGATLAMRPGSPCSGAGRYLYLKPGLLIAPTPDASMRIVSVDPRKPEVRLLVSEQGKEREVSLAADHSLQLAGSNVRLEGQGANLALVVD